MEIEEPKSQAAKNVDFESITCSSHFFCINRKGEFVCGGKNFNGQLGIGDKKTRCKIGKFSKLFQNCSISCGASHSLFLFPSGSVWGCGNNYGGKIKKISSLDTDSFLSKNSVPVEIDFLKGKKVKNIFATPTSSFFLVQNGEMICSGPNLNGELGCPPNFWNNEGEYKPKKIDVSKFLEDPKHEKIVDIKGGYFFSIILTNKGNVYSCGEGENGELGQGETKSLYKFKIIKFFKDKKIKILQIETGDNHSLFLSDDYNVYSCGSNAKGQLGSTRSDVLIPQLVSNIPKIKKIECGSRHSLFLSQDLKIFACGYNNYHQLAIKSEPDDIPERQIFGVTEIDYWGTRKNDLRYKFIDVYGMGNTTLFVNSFGEIYACGYNGNGDCCIGNFKAFIEKPKRIEGVLIGYKNRSTIKESIIKNKRKKKLNDIIIKTEF